MLPVKFEDRLVAFYFIPEKGNREKESRFFINGFDPWNDPSWIELTYAEAVGLVGVLNVFIDKVRGHEIPREVGIL